MRLWQMSLSGGAMILLIAALRCFLLHRLPRWTFPTLWKLALLRLLLPFSPLPLPRLRLPAAPVATDGVWAMSPALTHPAPHAPAQIAQSAPIPSPAFPWTMVWVLGAAACALFFLASYARLLRRFAQSLPVTHGAVLRWQAEHRLRRPLRVRQLERLSTPLTYGVLRPVILLPKGFEALDEAALRVLLTHEWIHARRFDAAIKLAMAAALCLHWPNPAVWLLYALLNRDLELSCDAAVLRRLAGDSRASYARLLIRLAAERRFPMPYASGFGKKPVEERIVSIMKNKKTSLLSLVMALLLIIGMTTAFASSAPEAKTGAVSGPLDVLYRTDQATGAHSISTDGGASWICVESGVTVTDDVMVFVTPSTDTLYLSFDDGLSWRDLDGNELTLSLATNDEMEWWTFEEYSAWLEKEKEALPACIGSLSWTPSRGWFTWTQEDVDAAIAQYEATMEDIRGGMRISKPMESSAEATAADGIAFSSVSLEETDVPEITTVVMVGKATDDEVSISPKEQITLQIVEEDSNISYMKSVEAPAPFTVPDFLSLRYGAFGIVVKGDTVLWQGQAISKLVDLSPNGGVFTWSDDGRTPGGLQVHTVYDSEGRLTGIEAG